MFLVNNDYLAKNKITNLANLTNLATDAKDVLSATNVGYVNQARADMITKLTDSFLKKINESHISSSDGKRDVFRYINE